jgi:hypothetical protein
MPEKADEIHLQDRQQTLLVQRITDGFVDDTTILQKPLLFIYGTIQEIAARIQTAVQWWEQLMHTACGQLELPECFYYLLHWVFDSEGYAGLATPEELDIQISLRQSADDQESDIPQRSYTISQGTPGVHESSASDYKTEYTNLRYGQPTEVSIFLVCAIATSFARQELAAIHRKSYSPSSFLAWGLIERCRQQSFWSSLSRGIGLRHVYVVQGLITISV